MAKSRSEASREASAKQAIETMVVSPNAGREVPPDRASKTGKEPPPKMAEGYERITERVFSLADPDGIFERLIDALEIKEALTPQAVAEAANRCETNALDAHQLYICARADHERFEAENEKVMAALREAATSLLQNERAGEKGAKSITEKDVTARVAASWPDEWTDIVTRQAKAKGMLEHLERLASLWRYRSANMTNIRGQHGGQHG